MATATQITTNDNSWASSIWEALAGTIGWINNAIGVNQCTGPNEYYDANTGKCVAIPQCGSGTHLDTTTMSCVPDIGTFGLSTTDWLIIVGGGIAVVVLLVVLMRRK